MGLTHRLHRNARFIHQQFMYKKTSSAGLHTKANKKKKPKKLKNLVAAPYDAITIPGHKKDISVPLPKAYSSRFTEAAWYEWWVDQGYFKPANKEEKFVMLLPPPNVTGKLHIGHAFTGVIQDAIVRWNRMKGKSVVWIPGLDHAGIATQIVVEKKLWKDEHVTRHELGREEFLRHVWSWKYRKEEEITSQLKRMGLSLDWSRHTFTMDKHMVEAVNHAFCELYEKGLITRNVKMINWSCILKSTIADIEVNSVAIDGPQTFDVPGYSDPVAFGYLTHFAYPVVDSKDNEELVVATTRLETMLGDTAVAVNPQDTRYQHLIGRHLKHPFSERTIPIIADEFVKPDFGTGAVKLTPAHSSIDHDIALKHQLRHIDVLDDDGLIRNCGEQFDGMKRFHAREKIAQLLQRKDLWRGQVPHAMTLPVCSRSSDIIEPRLKEQWFLDCSAMAQDAIKAADHGLLKFNPEYYTKIWRNFLEETKSTPWCISRQLWWGHNIPAYKVIDNKEPHKDFRWVVAPTLTRAISKAKEMLSHSDFKLIQDDDVLDTWFSSALLPFASLGWPNQSTDLLTFYPGNMIESGSDILFFWIARMVMLGRALTSQLPFSQVLIHSLLLANGEKMSKSKGNVLDPMSFINGSTIEDLERSLDESHVNRKERSAAMTHHKQKFPNGIPPYGADTLRMALASHKFKGSAVNIEAGVFDSYVTFCNKIWQIFKFYEQYFTSDFIATPVEQMTVLSSLNQFILSRCSNLVTSCDAKFQTADLDEIVHELVAFYQHDVSKLYLECSKSLLNSADVTDMDKVETLSVAVEMLSVGLRCLSPFMPYLTEELYQRLPLENRAESICIATFPQVQHWEKYRNRDVERQYTQLLEISTAINAFKSNLEFQHQSKRLGQAYVMSPVTRVISSDVLGHLSTLSRLSEVHINTIPADEDNVCSIDVDNVACDVLIDIGDALKNPKEVHVMILRIQKIMKSQAGLLDTLISTDTSLLDTTEQQKHQHKMEAVRRELSTAENCVKYLLKHIG